MRRIAIVPMGFCFPGQDAAGGDLPPRRECALTWHARLFAAMPQLQLILAVLVGANFAVTACFEVALPVLSHARFGPGGYGAIMACFGAASVAGTLTAARAGGLSASARPGIWVPSSWLI